MVQEVTPEEVKRRVDDESSDTQVVDTRSPGDYQRGHIPGAINIPLGQLPAKVGEVDWGDDIVCVCPMGESSVQAAKLIQSFEGVTEDASVASMEGGYREWEYELEEGSEEPDARA